MRVKYRNTCDACRMEHHEHRVVVSYSFSFPRHRYNVGTQWGLSCLLENQVALEVDEGGILSQG